MQKKSREQQLLSGALYRVGDVVTTTTTVPVVDHLNAKAGGALPGWKWRITEVFVQKNGSGFVLRYAVVAHTAPKMYHATLTPKSIARKIQ